MTPMQYLKKAQIIVDKRGDSDWFAQYYTAYRENFGVMESAQRALHQLYNDWNLINEKT